MKKNLAVFCTAMIALSATADLMAQTRGANYNPPSRSGSSSSSSSSASSSRPSSSSSSSSSTPGRGSNYNPPSRSTSTPSSSSSSSSSSTTRPASSSSSSSSSSSTPGRGANYNPPSSSSSSSSSQTTRPSTPASSSSSTPGRGANYNPPSSSSSSSSSTTYLPSQPTQSRPSTSHVPRGPRYNPPVASSYSVPAHQQGRVTVYRPVYHVPRVIEYRTIRYSSYRDYAVYVNHRYIYRNWIQEPVIFSYSNGYWMLDNYPYYVHRGFRYRYHPVEQCRYQLVDSSSYTAYTTYPVRNCTVAYDQCANDRDNLNRYQYNDRYFCAENVDYDLANNNTYDWNPYANDVNDSQQASIENYLWGKSYLDIFYDAQNYGVGSCQIQKTYNSSYYNNEYEVKVGSYNYPETDGSVNSSTASWIGCNVGSAEENAGCIMKAAIQEGYCL